MTVIPDLDPSSTRPPRHVGALHQRHTVIERGGGTGRQVLLLHGLASLADEILYPLGGPLTDAGFRVVAIDRPGYGGSDAVVSECMGPKAQAVGLHRTLASLEMSEVIVVAHSVGAATALHLSQWIGPNVAGLVLINPFCRPTRPKAAVGLRAATAPLIGPIIRRLLPLLAAFLGPRMVRATLHPGQAMPDVRAFPWRRMAQSTAVQAMANELQHFNADMIGFRSCLKALSLPVLVLIDPDDPVIDSRAHARWLAHRLPTSAVRWHSTGHLLHHANPAAVLDAVQSIDVAAQMQMQRIA